MNLEDAYTLEKRAYSDSMLGVIAASSTTSNTVGESRTLTYDANITSNRGYIIPGNKNDTSNLNMGNSCSLAELATPLIANHDSSMRVNMVTAQNKQSIPIKETNRNLIVNGAEGAISHTISDDFIFHAKEDGQVIAYDTTTNIMVVEYVNGKRDSIELGVRMAKNGGGGFFINNALTPQKSLNEKFKKGDILAKNEKFFKTGMDGKEVEFAMQKLAKIAIYAGDYTHEDSSLVTENLCDAMTSLITMKKDKVLSKHSNVDFIVKKGAKIKTGDPLLIFEQGYEEEEVNAMLAKIADELEEEITKLSKNQVLSKYTGTVDDIKIYYTCDIQELSPSLQKIVKSYNSTITSKEKLLKMYYDNINEANIILPPTEKVDTTYGKVRGVEMVDSIMFEFYITYEDRLGVGDKISFQTALKSIISTVVPTELAPYSEFRPDEEISGIMSYISVNARMCCSIYLELYCNKVLIELKRKCKEIWDK